MKNLLLSFIFIISSSFLFAQVGINSDGRAPDPSAGLDINFTDKGFLLPRMDFEQRNGIESPAEGLMIYCTDCSADASGALCIFQNGLWRVINLDCAAPYPPAAIDHISSLTQIIWGWDPVPIAIGYKWNTVNDYYTATDLGMETSVTETGLSCWTTYTRYVWAYNLCGQSPVLILNGSTVMIPFSPAPSPAFQIPTAYNISWSWFPVDGALGYRWNTTNDPNTAIILDGNTEFVYLETGLNCQTSYTRYIWSYDECGISTAVALNASTTTDPPPSPASGTHLPSVTEIIWNWNTVAGATGYKWSLTNIYATATDMGTSTSTIETGLSCNTSYTRYVWAYSNCGVSAPNTLTQATSLNPPAAPAAAAHVPSPEQIIWNWNTVTGATGYKWSATNNYTTATDMGTLTTRTETGLSCNTPYTRYVWAYSSCGVSAVTSLNQTTSLNPPASPVAAAHVPTPVQIIWNWNTVANATGYKWNTSNDYGSAQDMLAVTSKTESGLSCNTPYTRYVWAYSNCGVSAPATLTQTTSLNPPVAPVAATHVPAPTQVIWNWNTVAGATGYKWNSTNDYGSAQDMLAVTSKTETGLSCNTPYTRYVWAYSNCGVSSVASLTQTTSLDPPAAPAALAHVPSPTQIIWNWNTVAGATGYRWSTSNNYATATNLGNTTTFTETGLTCNQPYTRYIWAYSSCGVSGVTTLTQSTSLNPPASPVAATHVPTPVQITWNWNTVTDATGYKWSMTNNYAGATDMGMATSRLETGLSCNTPYTRYIWAYSNCGFSPVTILTQSTSLNPPAAPGAGTHVPSITQIIWNWNTVAGATGYKWSLTNNYSDAIDMGTTRTRTETGLVCNTPYERYVWAYSSCGVSNVTTLTQSTSLNPPANPTTGTHVPALTQIIWNWNTVAGATGYKWSTSNEYSTATDMGISITTTETGLSCNFTYNRFVWAYSNCGVSTVTTLTQATSINPPAAPVAGTHEALPTQITWHWNTVSGATGYKWSISNEYGTATDMGTATSSAETGLSCNTPYTRYVWAYSNCGVSSATTLTWSTALDPPAAPIAGTHVASPVQIVWNWNVVSGATGYKWHTSDTYGAAEEMNTATSKTETGMSCDSLYTRYVWAYGACGVSATAILTASTTNDPPSAPVAAAHVATPLQIIWNWNTVAGATGYKWGDTDVYADADVMNTATSKTETGLTCNTPYTRYIWAYNDCNFSAPTTLTQSTALDPPSAPVTGTHVPSLTQIVWNWNTVAGATGYKWSATNDYGTAEEMNAATAKTQSGLVCNTPYTSYVWAYSGCGVSAAATLTQSTLANPPVVPVAGTHTPSAAQIVWNWNTVSGATGYKWNTTSDYGSAEEMGTITSKTEDDLACNTAYTRYVWAYGPCGVSTARTLTQNTTSEAAAPPVEASHVANATQIIWNWNAVSGATGYKWSATNSYSGATDMGNSTSKTETTLVCNTPYMRYVWAYNNCGESTSITLTQSTTNTIPAAPAAGTHVPSYEQIVWNWNTVIDASGYKWGTTSDYGSAIEMAMVTSRTETGLLCSSSYTRYVWAYNACGVSTPLTLTQSTLNCWFCGDPIPVNHVAGNVAPVDKNTTYGTVTGVPGETSKCWITKNLGASQQGIIKSDNTEASAGWYWQFNRMQGYKHDGSTRTPNTTWVNDFNEYSVWIAANDPCALEIGSGWRVPTITEWGNVDAAGSWVNWNGPYNSLLKIHAAGRLDYSTGIINDRGAKGYYWSSTQTGLLDQAQNLFFYSSSCVSSLYHKAYGFPVRCIKQ